MKQQILRTAFVWIGLVAFMMTTQPAKLPVILLIAPFVVLFLVIFETWLLIQVVYARYLSKTRKVKKRSQLGRMVSLSIVLLIVLQSLQQLTVRDACTVLAILVLGYLYVVRNRNQIQEQ